MIVFVTSKWHLHVSPYINNVALLGKSNVSLCHCIKDSLVVVPLSNRSRLPKALEIRGIRIIVWKKRVS
jgi:hypothetical protein